MADEKKVPASQPAEPPATQQQQVVAQPQTVKPEQSNPKDNIEPRRIIESKEQNGGQEST